MGKVAGVRWFVGEKIYERRGFFFVSLGIQEKTNGNENERKGWLNDWIFF